MSKIEVFRVAKFVSILPVCATAAVDAVWYHLREALWMWFFIEFLCAVAATAAI